MLQRHGRDADPDLVLDVAFLRKQRDPSFAVAKARRERAEFFQEHRGSLAALAIVVVAACALIALTARGLAIGILVGAGLASFVWAVYVVVTLRSYNAVIGAKAERWTARMLRAAPDAWRCVPNVPFEKYDIDYVILTADAVLAVEVKWRPELTPKQQAARHHGDLDQAMQSHRQMRLFLYSCHLKELPVVPVLLLWGPGIPDLPDGREIQHGVHVLDGNEFDKWKHHYETGHRLLASIDALEAALAQHVDRVKPHHRRC